MYKALQSSDCVGSDTKEWQTMKSDGCRGVGGGGERGLLFSLTLIVVAQNFSGLATNEVNSNSDTQKGDEGTRKQDKRHEI
jgi:hypothetical protein